MRDHSNIYLMVILLQFIIKSQVRDHDVLRVLWNDRPPRLEIFGKGAVLPVMLRKYLWNICKILFEMFFLNICETAGLSGQRHLAKNQFWKKFCLVEPIMQQILQVRCLSIIVKESVSTYYLLLAKVCFKGLCWLQRMSYKPTHKERTPPSHPIEKSTVVHDALLFHPLNPNFQQHCQNILVFTCGQPGHLIGDILQ